MHNFLFIALSCLTFIHNSSLGQVTLQNIGFETGTLSGWNGFTGNCCPVSTPDSGLIGDRHTITTGPGTDPWSNGIIPVTAPGSLYSVKLGNDSISSESERLSALFVVPFDSLILLISYATVIENGLHPDIKQSRFNYDVSSTGATPEGCTNIEVLAGDTAASIITIGDIEIQPWQTKAINLFGLTGDTIIIQFTTADCAPGGHFGYAYVDCEVVSANLISNGCDSNGTLHATINPDLDVRWHDGSSLNTISIVQPEPNGNYFAEFNYNSNCNFKLPLTLDDIIEIPSFNYHEGCNNQIIFNNTSNTPPGTDFTWEFGDGYFSNIINPMHQFTAGNQFQVVLNAHLPNNCNSNSFANITMNPPIVENIFHTDSCVNSDITFVVFPNSSLQQITSYEWHIGNLYISNEPSLNYSFNLSGTYTISLGYELINGCKDSINRVINIHDDIDCYSTEHSIFIPNAFSPNNDGINDTFKLYHSSGSKIPVLQIFNRFGELVYEGVEWDGQFKGKKCMSGVYYYKCLVKSENKSLHKTGILTLVR